MVLLQQFNLRPSTKLKILIILCKLLRESTLQETYRIYPCNNWMLLWTIVPRLYYPRICLIRLLLKTQIYLAYLTKSKPQKLAYKINKKEVHQLLLKLIKEVIPWRVYRTQENQRLYYCCQEGKVGVGPNQDNRDHQKLTKMKLQLPSKI